jgi:hypothetical protein
MASFYSDFAAKRPWRPVRQAARIKVHFTEEALAALDRWRSHQNDQISRTDAIRFLVDLELGEGE